MDARDEPVVRDIRILSISHTQKYVVGVGTAERHEIRIERTGLWSLPGLEGSLFVLTWTIFSLSRPSPNLD
jgi:hypothetical protein